jgi:hypothetical protein
MALHHTIWAYLWDLEDDGIADSVSLLKGEIGLDAVSVATAYHSFEQLRPNRLGPKLMKADQAAVYFQPESSLYRDTCLRPRVAAMCLQDNPLDQLARAASAKDLGLISWTVCLHNTWLATSYPHCAEQGAYGDHPGWSLCPSSDDVRSYVISLCTDLARNYGVSRIELESCHFGGYGHYHHHLKEGVDLGTVGRYLFSLCFSEGCRARAGALGLDPYGLRSWVAGRLDRVLAGGSPLDGDVAEFLSEHVELGAYQRMREDVVTDLVREVRRATGVEISCILMGDPWTTGARRERIAAAADLIEVLAYTDTPAVVAQRVQEVASGPDEARRLVVGLQAYHPCACSEAALAEQVHSATGAGVTRFSYYNYGIMPRANLEWVESCIKAGQKVARPG